MGVKERIISYDDVISFCLLISSLSQPMLTVKDRAINLSCKCTALVQVYGTDDIKLYEPELTQTQLYIQTSSSYPSSKELVQNTCQKFFNRNVSFVGSHNPWVV